MSLFSRVAQNANPVGNEGPIISAEIERVVEERRRKKAIVMDRIRREKESKLVTSDLPQHDNAEQNPTKDPVDNNSDQI